MYIPVRCALCGEEADQDDYTRSILTRSVCDSCYNVFMELKRTVENKEGNSEETNYAAKLYNLAWNKITAGKVSGFDWLFTYAEEKWGE